MSYGAKTYKQTSISTASSEQILLMLYEAAIKSCKLAKIALEKKNIAEKCRQITKAHDIILELNNTLDRQKGGEVALQLESLYDYATSQLLKANMDSDSAALDSVIKVLSTLYEGWVVAVEDVRKKEKESAMKITKEDLLSKLKELDNRILNLWIDEELEMEDEERWELFVVLLETRVELLQCCKNGGLKLDPEIVLPPWLLKMTRSRQELRLRDMKKMYEENESRKKMKTYEAVASLGEKNDEL